MADNSGAHFHVYCYCKLFIHKRPSFSRFGSLSPFTSLVQDRYHSAVERRMLVLIGMLGLKEVWRFTSLGSFGITYFYLRNCEIAIGMCQFVIASTCAYWYFSHLNRSDASSPVCYSFIRALLYHFGSICLGALVLTILVILQLVL